MSPIPVEKMRAISDYFEQTQPAEVRHLLVTAHRFLQDNLPPFATCAIKWRLPFYSLNRSFCYLNRHPDHITLGFSYGYKLGPRPGVLLDESGKLKNIRFLELRSVDDIFSQKVYGILQEAMMIDEIMGQPKSGRRVRNRLR